ncbi:MAG: hypothetical protein Q8R98_07150 [Rubrivivax sp.]|nr:hypothetical protein [Rubrivivax sp.]MDP3611611.1 hypothetical protein [Rubrivivax sp.]
MLQLSCLVGKSLAAVPAEDVHRTLVNNLRYAAGELKAAGLGWPAQSRGQ